MSDLKPFTDSSNLMGQPDALRARIQQDGYLFLPGLVPTQALTEVYDAIMAICKDCGWADSEGHAQGPARIEGAPEFWEVYDRVQQLEVFHALAHRPELFDLIEVLV